MPKGARRIMAMQERAWNRGRRVLASPGDCWFESEHNSNGASPRKKLLITLIIVFGALTFVFLSFFAGTGVIWWWFPMALSCAVAMFSVFDLTGNDDFFTGTVSSHYRKYWTDAFAWWRVNYQQSYWFQHLTSDDQRQVIQGFIDADEKQRLKAVREEQQKQEEAVLRDNEIIDGALAYLDDCKQKLILRNDSVYALDTIQDMQRWFRDKDTTYTHPEVITERERGFLPKHDYDRIIRPAITVKNSRVRARSTSTQ